MIQITTHLQIAEGSNSIVNSPLKTRRTDIVII